MRLAIAATLGLAACAGTLSQQQYQAAETRASTDNAQRSGAALAAWRTAHASASEAPPRDVQLYMPEQLTADPSLGEPPHKRAEVGVAVAAAPAHGLLEQERIVRDPSTQQLAFESYDCPRGCCGLVVPKYVMFRDGVGLAIVRIRPALVERKVRLESGCMRGGCGGGAYPPDYSHEPHSLALLGVSELDQVTIYDVPYRHEVLATSCEHEHPYNPP